MVDYSKWDKLAALISSSDDEDNDDQSKYDVLMRDKFNTSIHSNKAVHNKASSKHHDDDIKLPPINTDIQDEDVDYMANEVDDMALFDQHYEEVAPIFTASNQMYNEYKQKYHQEISEASNKIEPPTSTRSKYEIDNKLNQWSHELSMDLLNLIFEFAINEDDKVPNANQDIYDAEKDPRRFTIILLRVCKSWRLCCLNNDAFWSPVIEFVVRGGKHRGIGWKQLVTVPIRYLDQFCRYYNVDHMTEKERDTYYTLLAQNGYEMDDSDDGYGCYDECSQINPFLIIQCLKYCRNTWRLYLTGTLCDDIFYAMGKYCNDLKSLDVSFVRSGNCVWFRHLVKEDSRCMDTLFQINLERSYWCDDEALKYLGRLRNLQSIEMDRLYGVSAKGLKYLFEGDRGKEMRNIYLTRAMKYYNDTVDFMKLMIKNGKKMMQLDFSECEGFNDEMLQLLEKKTALPDLKTINIMYTGCSSEQVERLQAKRPQLEIDFEDIEW